VGDNVTLGIAWVRNIGTVRELVIASDSRLSGGQFWDANPKIMMLPRSDAIISFAGDTHDAYPLMLQIYNAILIHPAAQDRALDLPELKGHVIRVINKARSFVSNLPIGHAGPVIADAQFMLAGYSWRQKRFCAWTLHHDNSIQRFTFKRWTPWQAQSGYKKEIAFVGDSNVVARAKSDLVSVLQAKGKLSSGGLDMEPLEVLRDLLRANQFAEIGGSPQVVKVYEYMKSHAFPIYWPSLLSGEVTVLGRPLMAYEKPRGRIIDPDNL
jgi:uncharacterized ubiquitin-like protein YukD